MGFYRMKVLQYVVVILVAAGLLVYFYAAAWLREHPVLGKVILAGIGLLAAWQLIQWIRNALDDPFTRIKPHKDDE